MVKLTDAQMRQLERLVVGPTTLKTESVVKALARRGLAERHVPSGMGINFRHVWRIVRARHAAIWLIWWKHGYSMTQVGRLFGGRDHSTIWFAIGSHLCRCRAEHWTVTSVRKKRATMARQAAARAEKRGGWKKAA